MGRVAPPWLGSVSEMALHLEKHLTAPGSPALARLRLAAALAAAGLKITAQSDSHVTAITGSVARLRLFGRAGSTTSSLPLEVKVSFAADGDSTAVLLLLRDRVGTGVRAGLDGTYTRRFEELAAYLAHALGARPAMFPVSTESVAFAGHWAPDPLGRHELRYWDGAQWTSHVSDRGVVGSDPISQPDSDA